MSTDRKVAIVTGASQGIGAGIVQAYRGLGYAVVANSRAIEGGQDPEVVTVAGDIGERAVAEQVVRTAVDRFGRIDTLVNNAGIFIGKPFTDYTVEDFERALHVNVAGFFHVTQLVVPRMLAQGGGHIVQITTTLVDQPIAGAPSGLAGLTKGGLAAVTRGLAIEYADRGIRVNAVAPGIIRTPMHAEDALAALAKLHPMGRLGEVDDVVEAILYLERAPFVTGEILNVDGGQHAGRW
ncbi:SDR family NAD(P)-dependent oxidoreductase [Methylobacterium nigriterrae]|uniref:SDR family NAD(P)-dependent oxidoreductase n=1 Tax=Methylobacterium nigriterrae TaxID=3127512 RepID=UPI003013FA69